MKKINFILSLASVTLAVVGANAASTPTESEIVHLPTYRVESARYTPAERAVDASLAELRASAKAPMTRVAAPFVVAKAATDSATFAADIAKRPTPAARLAKN